MCRGLRPASPTFGLLPLRLDFGRRFGRWLLIAVAFALVLGFGTGALAQPTSSVTAAHAGLHADSTRLVLSLSRSLPFEVFTLADPHRVVIDLPEVNWPLADSDLPRATGVIAGVRHGRFRPGTSRIVVRLTHPVAVRAASLLAPARHGQPYRLVVDLVRATPATVAAEGDTEEPGIAGVIGHTVLPIPVLPQPLRRPAAQRVIVIDAGHGGKDPGAIGPSGIHEKEITLDVARAVRAALQRIGGYRVVLTRNSDVFIRLRSRVAKARAAGADLFVSLHADAMGRHSVRGSSVYTLSERASDAEAAALADRENKADLIVGMDLSDKEPVVANILIDLAQRETMNQSAQFARLAVRELGQETEMLEPSHRFAGFAVLKAPDVPSVLIELGFLSNRTDEAMLGKRRHQQRLARAIAHAIHGYFADVQSASLR
jgi:N-acetylmuramoyl-L-alanine amidase